ncbi:MAG TPA: F0F1 ATP synthase subunit A, partial [Chthoniobacterales bacterium]|nr:F0F1 ATP synthase subunit A [Chthoniobacterales bacterium]
MLLIAALFAGGGFAATALGEEPTHVATIEEEHHLPLKATLLYYGIGGHPPTDLAHPETAKIGFLAVSNSMLVTWIVAAGVLLGARLATRKIKPVPTGLQNFWEWLVESLHNFLEGMIGAELVKRTFWFFATIFIFILFVNWFGLIPGVGTIGFGHHLAN